MTYARALEALTCAAVIALTAAGCKHVPSKQDRELSIIHYDLGIQEQNKGNMQGAYTEFEKSLQLDPGNALAHNAMGLVLHLGFQRHQEAISHFEQAIALDPQFSEARVNLGNVYLDTKQYDRAATYYEQALNDMKYITPYIAHGNLGMAEYRRGNVEKAVDHIRSAVTMKPEFCLGYRNLGLIFEETGKTDEACREYARFREHCPEQAEAYYREGVCLAKLGQQDLALERFAACETKAQAGQLKEDCRRLAGHLQ